MIEAISRHLSRVVGLALVAAVSGCIIVWVSVLTAADLLETYEQEAGLERLFCLWGVQISETPCPRYMQDLEEARAARDEIARERAALAGQIALIEELEKSTDRYTLFTTETPESLRGVDIVTGAIFESVLERGAPEEYCYASRPGADGVSQRVSLTERSDGHLLWSDVTAGMAGPLGLTTAELEEARTYCRFLGAGPGS